MHSKIETYPIRIAKKLTRILLLNHLTKNQNSVEIKGMDSCLCWLIFLPSPLPIQNFTQCLCILQWTILEIPNVSIHDTWYIMSHRVASCRDPVLWNWNSHSILLLYLGQLFSLRAPNMVMYLPALDPPRSSALCSVGYAFPVLNAGLLCTDFQIRMLTPSLLKCVCSRCSQSCLGLNPSNPCCGTDLRKLRCTKWITYTVSWYEWTQANHD